MSGAGFIGIGPSAAPANTTFFPYVPNNYNMVLPGHWTSSGTAQTIDSFTPANNVNQWTIYNAANDGGTNAATVSLGATTTAPDGTNTAQKLVENSNNTLHGVICSASVGNSSVGGWKCRHVFYAKAGERTRVALYAKDPVANNYIHVVYDLAGVQIGVAPALVQGASVFPAQWATLPCFIRSWGNGWCECEFNFVLGGLFNSGIFFALYLDNGSGTAAESTTYAGDGSSGAYFWQNRMLPAPAWGMSGQKVFADDFTSTSTFDMTNSKKPGFNWYINGPWPVTRFAFNLQPNFPTAGISINGSVVTLDSTSGSGAAYPYSAVTDGGSGYIGNVLQPPALIEISSSFPTNINNFDINDTTNIWMVNVEMLTSNQSPWGSPPGNLFTEIDTREPQDDAMNPAFTVHLETTLGSDDTPVATQSMLGAQLWSASPTYNQNSVVYSGGTLYRGLTTTHNQIPASSPTAWTALSQPLSGYTVSVPSYDASQLQPYALLWIPVSHDDAGHLMIFHNKQPIPFINYGAGVTVGSAHALYGVQGYDIITGVSFSGFRTLGSEVRYLDSQHHVLLIQPDFRHAIPLSIDYIYVRK